MPKPLKYALVALASLAGLLLAAALIFAALFDPNDYKPLLVQQVQARYQRTLAIPGRIELSFFPSLGAKLGAVSLSEPNSDQNFLSLQSARLSVKLLPLLQRQLVVDRVELDGLQARLLRRKDGRLSIDDLLGVRGNPGAAAAPAPATGPASAAGGALSFDIAGVTATNAAINFEDQLAGRRVALTQAELRSGHIAPGTPTDASFKGHLAVDTPAVDADMSLKGRFTFDMAQRRYAAQDLAVELGGRAATLSELKASLAVPAFELAADHLKADKFGLQAHFRQGAMALQARLDGALEGDLQAQKFSAPSLSLGLDISRPGAQPATLALKASGHAQVDLARHTLASALSGQFDQSRFKASFGLASFSPAAYRFDMDIDQVDVDRYLGNTAPVAVAPANPGAPAPPEAALDLSAWGGLNASGSLRIAALQVAHLKATKLRIDLHAAGGRVDLNPLTGQLYEGSVSGSLGLVAGAVPRIVVKQTLSGISIGPLLKDATGKASLEGRGTVTLDVSTQGGTVTALKKALGGSAKLELRDGMVKGFNIAQSLRSAKAKLGGAPQAGTGSAAEASDFSALSGSFRIDQGVAHNDDLQASSPLLRVAGSGNIDLGESRIDYLVKATVVATLEGQGGPELQALRGQTVAVHLTGPFTAIGYHVDLAGLARDIAKDKLDDKAKAALNKAKQSLGDKLKGLLGK